MNGQMRLASDPSACRNGEQFVAWSIVGPQGPAGPGSGGVSYAIPRVGGSYGGGYLRLYSANGHFTMTVYCNYSGYYGAQWFAEVPSVTAGSVLTMNNVDGYALTAHTNLSYGSGGQNAQTLNPNPWHGVFTATEAGTPTRWDVSVIPLANSCIATVYANNGGAAYIQLP